MTRIRFTLASSALLFVGTAHATPDALAAGARQLGVEAEQLAIVHQVSLQLPDGSPTIFRAKVRDSLSGRIRTVDFAADGQKVDVEARIESSRGVQSPVGTEVEARLGTSDEGDLLPVAFWLHAGELPVAFPDGVQATIASAKGTEHERLRAERLWHLEEVKTVMEEAQAPFLTALTARGARVNYASPLAPLVYAQVPASELVELAYNDAVEHVYGAWNQSHDELDVQACALDVDPEVWDSGYTGTGVIVAHCEDSRADRDNTCLECDTGANLPSHSNIDQHSTACTGMMVSSHSTYKGIAYGACFYSANGGSYSDSDMAAAIDAGTQNADLTSHSWGQSTNGQLNVHDRHIDYVVRNSRHFHDDSAGNTGNSSYLTSPGNGFNICTVANFDDRNSCSKIGDSMSSSSSGRNPPSTHGDREKPEVAGPGTNITSLRLASPGSCPTGDVGSGTSYAAPVVGAVAALAMEAAPELIVWPETTKALLMASGLHNIEGDRRLSDLDGTGGVSAIAVVTSAARGRWRAHNVTSRAFGSNQTVTMSVGEIAGGSRFKGVICWDANPDSGYLTDPVDLDLDLELLGESGEVLATSATFDNTYEVVDVDVATTQVIRARISYRNWNGTSEYIGGAWTITKQ